MPIVSKYSNERVEKIIQDKYGNNKVIYCDIGENPSLAFEISVSNYIKIKRTIMVTENTDLYSDLANYFSYRKDKACGRFAGIVILK